MDRQEGRQFGHQAMLLSATHRSGLRRESLGGWEGKVWGQCRNKWRRRSCKLCLARLVLICVCVCVQPIHLQSKPFMCLVVPEAFQDEYKHATSQVVLVVLFFSPRVLLNNVTSATLASSFLCQRSDWPQQSVCKLRLTAWLMFCRLNNPAGAGTELYKAQNHPSTPTSKVLLCSKFPPGYMHSGFKE